MTHTHQVYDYIIIGAGTAGCYLAKRLCQQGADVLVLEKSRGLGGRCSRRMLDVKGHSLSIDLGATVIDPESNSSQNNIVSAIYRDLQAKNILQTWSIQQASFASPQDSKSTDYLCAINNLNQLHKHWMQGVSYQTQTRITKCQRQADQWLLYDEGNTLIARSHKLICTAPAQQSQALVQWPDEWQANIQKAADNCQPQWVCALASPIESKIDIYQGSHPILAKAILESQKPGRNSEHSIWLLQSSYEWAKQHLDTKTDDIGLMLKQAFAEVLAYPADTLQVLSCHRWLLAQNPEAENDSHSTLALWDTSQALGIAADWLSSGDIGGALLSAETLLSQLNAN